jgi:hypothetical protein
MLWAITLFASRIITSGDRKREESVKQHASAANKEKVESTKNACTIPGEKCHDTTSKGEEAENKDD